MDKKEFKELYDKITSRITSMLPEGVTIETAVGGGLLRPIAFWLVGPEDTPSAWVQLNISYVKDSWRIWPEWPDCADFDGGPDDYFNMGDVPALISTMPLLQQMADIVTSELLLDLE